MWLLLASLPPSVAPFAMLLRVPQLWMLDRFSLTSCSELSVAYARPAAYPTGVGSSSNLDGKLLLLLLDYPHAKHSAERTYSMTRTQDLSGRRCVGRQAEVFFARESVVSRCSQEKGRTPCNRATAQAFQSLDWLQSSPVPPRSRLRQHGSKTSQEQQRSAAELSRIFCNGPCARRVVP